MHEVVLTSTLPWMNALLDGVLDKYTLLIKNIENNAGARVVYISFFVLYDCFCVHVHILGLSSRV